MADLEGRTLDRYELQQLTGRGGMADVYLGHDPLFEREVAVKVFKREDEDLLRRFIREAQLMASLHNSHLMPVYDTGFCRIEGMNVYYIVMPFMEGGTLRARIRRSPIALKQACRYLRDIAEALDYMHQQGIIHRDIKASNVLLDAEGRCYLADFGIARTASDSTQLTSTGNVLGTVDYIAPELFESNYRADARSDYYSLGVLLYEMVTGHLPFVAENQIAVVTMHVNKLPPSPRTYVPSISPVVEQVILKALEKRPELRYRNAEELAEAFCRGINARQTAVLPVAQPQQQQNDVFANSGRIPAQYPAQAVPPPVTRSARVVAPAMSTGHYDVAPGIYPGQAPVYPRSSPPPHNAVRIQAWIVTTLAILALVAVAIPMTYAVMTTMNHPSGGSPSPFAVATVTPDVQSTSEAVTATAVQQENGSATAVAQATATAYANATVTATQKKDATATAQARVTATAQAGVTATAQAHASATAGVIQTAIATNPTYADPLTNKDNADTQAAQWDGANGLSSTCSFHDDGYYVLASNFNAFVGCQETGKQFQNFAVQVDVSIQSGHSGGVFFRSSVNPHQGYLFEIDSQGKYKVSVSKNLDLGSMDVLRDWTASPDLKNGTDKNRLQVIARDGTLLFYINGVYQADPIQDTTLTSGGVGFLATWDSGVKAKVVYSNLSIFPLS